VVKCQKQNCTPTLALPAGRGPFNSSGGASMTPQNKAYKCVVSLLLQWCSITDAVSLKRQHQQQNQ
jgi:hypothetical protein